MTLNERALVNYDHPDSLDVELFVNDLRDLRDGKTIDTPIYDMSTHTRSPHTRIVAPADLVVLDVMLPDINGKEVVQRVRSDSNLDGVRIICISGMVEEDKVDELRAEGADEFIHKPFEIERLIELICQQLDIEQVPATA